MGIVNVFKGLGSEREIHRFNGRLRKNLDLDWKHCKMLLGDREITKNHAVKEDDVVYIREYPGIATTGFLIGLAVVTVLTATAAVVTGVVARNAARDARRQMEDALNRIRNDNRRRDVESIPHLSGARNEFAEGKQAPIILGRHLFAPYFLSEPYLEVAGTDGADLYWYGTFLVGQTGLNLEKLRNGKTDLVSFDGEHETPSGTYRFDAPPASEGLPPFHDPENLAEVRQGGWFDEGIFSERWEDSLGANVEIGRKRREDAGTVEDIFVEDDGPEPVIRESAGFPMRIEAEVLIDGLHGWNSDNGTPTDATVELRMEWARSDAGPWLPMPGWGNMVLTRRSTTQMRFVAALDLPTSVFSRDGAPVFVRATRITRQHTGGYRSRTVFSALRTKQYSPSESSSERLVPARNMADSLVGKFCRIGVKLKVNENTQDALDRFNVIASMTGRTWDGERWSLGKRATSNPAAVALELMTGLIHGPSRHADAEIDTDGLGALYEWCDSREVATEAYGIRPVKLEACGVLTGATRKLDALRNVLATCDAGLYVSEFGKLTFWYDDFRDTPIALLNPQRIVSMNETRELSRRLDGYAVRFIDRLGDWSERAERIMRPGVERNPGNNTFDRFGPEYVTDYHHAMWLARRAMAREILQPGTIEVEVGREGRHFTPGSLIKVQHEGFRVGIGSGEIAENIVEGGMVVGIRTMERYHIRADRDYFVDYYVVDEDRNHVVNRRIQSVGEHTDRLMFTTPIAHAHDRPALGNIVSVIDGLREGFARVWESRQCVVMDSSASGYGYRLTLARYDDEIYRTTTIDAIPEYMSRILPTAPRVYSPPPREPYLPPPQGVVPEIRDGHWWIGGIDTGMPASGENGRSLSFRGEWRPGQYFVDDVVTFQGRTFICIETTSVSGATPPWPLTNPLAAQRFALLVDKGADGRNGLGLDALPRPHAYWSCDDLPEIPDNQAGTVYRNDPQWSGWANHGAGIVRENGILGITGNAFVARNPISVTDSTVVLIRARWTGGNAPKHLALDNDFGGHATPVLAREWEWYQVRIHNANLTISGIHTHSRTSQDGWEVSDLYIGDGSFLFPLMDSAGDNHAAMPASGGVIPVRGRHGRGLNFLAPQTNARSVATPIVGGFFQRDFTVSVWVNPHENTPDHWRGIMGNGHFFGIWFNTTGNIALRLGNRTVDTSIPLPAGTWTHVIVKRSGNAVLWKVNNGRGGSVNEVPGITGNGLAIGNYVPWGGAGAVFMGLIDEIALFDFATSDDQDAALYRVALSTLGSLQPPPWDERYRGVTAIADTGNTGRINGEVMHRGNFVMFTGATVGIWQTARLMQWNGARWHRLEVEANKDKYMLALNDLTAGAPEGIFSTAFIRTLFADMAIVGILQILCTIRSANFSDTAGWQLNANGEAILNHARIRGHIEAVSGFFNNIHIGDRATFEGSIASGPLIASNEISMPAGRTWPVQTTIATIKYDLGIGINEARAVSVSGGSFGAATGLIQLEFSRIHFRTVTGVQGIPMPVMGDRLRIVFPNTTFTVEDTSPSGMIINQGRISQALTIGGTASGKTLRFIDLPTGGGGLPVGTVFRDSSGFLRIV